MKPGDTKPDFWNSGNLEIWKSGNPELQLSEYSEHRHGVASRAKDDKHVPNGVIISVFLVFVKEIRAAGISHSFRYHPPERRTRHQLPHRPDNHQSRPPHRNIQRQRQLGVLAQGNTLADDSRYHTRPEKTEHRPAYPSSYHRQTNRRITAGYHHKDTNMIEHAQATLVRGTRLRVIPR